MNVYIILLEGGGDVFATVVDKETFDWVTSEDPGQPSDYNDESSWIDQLVPQSQIDLMKMEDVEYEPLEITRGSWENDRAIAAKPLDDYDCYESLSEAKRAIKTKKDKLVDIFVGEMY